VTEDSAAAESTEPAGEADQAHEPAAADDVVPAEPIAAEAVAPYSTEAQKAPEEFAEEAPMADAVEETAGVPDDADAAEQETPAEHLMEHNADLEPTDDEARDEEADELRHEHERDDDDNKPNPA